jgi:LacI family transcriptional regulator
MFSQGSRNRITITDIARESDVSPATVSLVLRDKPGVGKETRQRVLASARRLGYQLTNPKSSIAANTTINSIGLVVKMELKQDGVPLLTNPFYASVLAGIEMFSRQRRINLFYAHMPVDVENNSLEPPRLLQEQSADGLLLVGMWLHAPIMELLAEQHKPIVLVDAYADQDIYDTVTTDNEAGAYQATRHLIEHGHQHIAIVGSLPQAYPSICERRQGYVRAMAEQGFESHFVDCHLEADEAVPIVTAYLREHPEISAIFSCNDEVAISLIVQLQNEGRRIPDDISVIGFDNIMLAQHVSPALTTMRVDKMGMGRQAASLLVNRIEYPQSALIKSLVRPQLIERDSVVSPPIRH